MAFETLKYETFWGHTYDVCFFSHSKYELDLSLYCISETGNYYEPFMDVTISNPYEFHGENRAYIKDYSENAGLGNWLVKNGIAKPTGKILPSGYVILEEYEFNMEKLNKYTCNI